MMKLQGSLPAPWDAQMLAERWPHLFALVDADRGTVTVKDVQGVVDLGRQWRSVDVDFDGEGLTLKAWGAACELVAA